MKTCTQCQNSFLIHPEDEQFYQDVSPIFNGKKELIPKPTLCPDCRQQRRLAWRNERNLYWRTCDGTGKKILSVFRPEVPLKVYDVDYWYSDHWDAKEYGRDFDFNRPFFEQFQELMQEVPQLSRSVVSNENCEFVNQCGWCRNCYLIFEADNSENCMYSNYITESKVCLDTLMINQCELCYQCIDTYKSYNVKYAQNCTNCSESWFLKNCIGCRNCFGCVNLKNKEYYFFNEPLSKEEYQKKMSELDLGDDRTIQTLKEKFKEFTKTFPNKSMVGVKNENSTGNYLNNTQNCHHCFDVFDSQDCAYVSYGRNLKKVQDMNVFGAKGVEFCYEVHEVGEGAKNILFSDQAWTDASDLLYSKLCLQNAQNLFGCVSMKKAQYCILNKQYTKEEYNQLVPKIIEHMRQTGEWGEFFPIEMSPFAYNETLANDYYPMEKAQVLQRGWQWSEHETKIQAERTVPADQLPHDIRNIPDDILNWAIVCERSGKPFKITAQELKFYRDQGLPLPKKHHDERHKDRLQMRSPRKLWDRNCGKCNLEIRTSYSLENDEIVYCEKCYSESLQ